MISVSCPDCGKTYKLKPTLIGKTGRCKVCDSSFKIEDPSASSFDKNEYAVSMETSANPSTDARRNPARPAPVEDDEFAALSSVSSDGATVDERPVKRKPMTVDDDDDLEDAPAKPKAKPKPKSIKQSDSGPGLFYFGGPVSASLAAMGGGAIGALIWGAIAYFTHHEVGYVAWGVGGLVGFCVKMAAGEMDEGFAGIIAATGAVVSILAGKLLAGYFMVQWVMQQGQIPGGIPVEAQMQLLLIAFKASFGILDIVFFLLAIATAYRLGSGQTGN